MGTAAKKKRRAGNPGVFRPGHIERARMACEAGFTDRELAVLFGVSEVTINKWKLDHPEFGLALKNGKHMSDNRVERNLFTRATGYSYDAEKIFNYQGKIIRAKYVEHVPPDVTAQIFWLKNRRPTEWRDKHDVNINLHVTLADLVNKSYAADLPAIPAPKVIEHEE